MRPRARESLHASMKYGMEPSPSQYRNVCFRCRIWTGNNFIVILKPVVLFAGMFTAGPGNYMPSNRSAHYENISIQTIPSNCKVCLTAIKITCHYKSMWRCVFRSNKSGKQKVLERWNTKVLGSLHGIIKRNKQSTSPILGNSIQLFQRLHSATECLSYNDSLGHCHSCHISPWINKK